MKRLGIFLSLLVIVGLCAVSMPAQLNCTGSQINCTVGLVWDAVGQRLGIGISSITTGFRMELQDVTGNYALRIRNSGNTQFLRFGASDPEISASGNTLSIRTVSNNSLEFRTNDTVALTLDTAQGGLLVGSLAAKSVRGSAVTVANLPSPTEGMLVAVTDSTTATWGAIISGTGGNHVLAYYNGTNWTVAGK